MKEFERIDNFLTPLTKGNKAALDLKDDCALLDYKQGYKLAVTKDAIIEDVHFLPNTDPALLARKLLGVNLSDMAAMGAKPLYYFIAAALSKNEDNQWFKAFTDELAKIQQEYDITLMGGDSVSHDGALMLTLTMMGEVEDDKILYRNKAKIGDDIYVSGTIGDAALGLMALQGKLKGDGDELVNRYNIPQPRVELGLELAEIIDCATDISDGLLADLGNICQCSGVGANIYTDKIPLSKQAKQALSGNKNLIKTILTGGDDYELVFTASKNIRDKIINIQTKIDISVTCIGKIIAGNNVFALDNNDNKMQLKKSGYEHS